jgi:hypothetical protein
MGDRVNVPAGAFASTVKEYDEPVCVRYWTPDELEPEILNEIPPGGRVTG